MLITYVTSQQGVPQNPSFLFGLATDVLEIHKNFPHFIINFYKFFALSQISVIQCFYLHKHGYG